MKKSAMSLFLTILLTCTLSPTYAADIAPPLQEVTRPVFTTEHIPYMTGYSDGTFRPDLELTRAQAAKIIYVLLADKTMGHEVCTYTDIKTDDWFYTAATTLCSLNIIENGTAFHPTAPITRRDFVKMLAQFVPATGFTGRFSDVPETDLAAIEIETISALHWIDGYADGKFLPDNNLTRAEAVGIMNRVMRRAADPKQSVKIIGLGYYSDVSFSHWCWYPIVEASIIHIPQLDENGIEHWMPLDWSGAKFKTGFHEIEKQLYYVDRYGKLVHHTKLGAYDADVNGVLTQNEMMYQCANVPYISQLDGISAWVGCEPTAALAGLKLKGYAQNIALRPFLDHIPRTSSNPEKGFVGSPYVPDPSKRTRTTIYPSILAHYCNSYCNGDVPCADMSGDSIESLRQELLAGNAIVAYMTLKWETPHYRDFLIEGKNQRLVSNNHAVLVCGYDPNRGYFISDPYNNQNRNQVYQYWENAQTFEAIWNVRRVGMVIR